MTTPFGPVEVRGWLGAEQVLTYPWAAIKLTNGVATWLHFDHLGSVRAITDATGAKVESAIYRPFGEQSEWLLPGNVSPETKGWIGERYGADAGPQYLNARYYDPALGMFLQPDWFEVTKPGVGTNRFSYSFNDPVNKFDPGGNQGAAPPSAREEAKKKPPTKSPLEKLADWFFGDESTRTGRHLENAVTEFGLAKDQYDTTLDPKDEMFLEHRKRAYAELGAIGQTSLNEAWNLVGEDFVEALMGGSMVTSAMRSAATPAVVESAKTLGVSGEASARSIANLGPKPTIGIPMNGRVRIPDGLTNTVLSEVKNVARLSFTRQLRDFSAYATQNGLRFDLYVRTSTTLTSPLQSAINAGLVNLRYLP